MKKLIFLIGCLCGPGAWASCDCWLDPAPETTFVYRYTTPTAKQRRRHNKWEHQHDNLPLHRAVMNDNVHEVAELCALNRDLNVQDAVDKRTPLCIAVVNDSVDIVKILLAQAHVDPNIPDKEKTPLMHAFENAWSDNDHEMVKVLLSSSKLNINAIAHYSGNTVLGQMITGYSPLDMIGLSLLLKRLDLNTNVLDYWGNLLLYEEINQGRAELACMLIAHPNTRLDWRVKSGRCKKIYGMTAIEIAYLRGNKRVVKYILDVYEQSKRAAIMLLMAHHERVGTRSPAAIIPFPILKELAAGFIVRRKPCPLGEMSQYRNYANRCCIQ